MSAIPLEFVHHADDGDAVVVGKAELLDDGRLQLTAARDSHRSLLGHAVQQLNQHDVLHVDAPPPPGSPKFANASRIVTRAADAEYIDALREHFRKYYKLDVEDVREP